MDKLPMVPAAGVVKGNLTDYDKCGQLVRENGITAINSLTFQTGNDKMQTYFSYANTRGTGIVDSNKLQKHNITFRETASFSTIA